MIQRLLAERFQLKFHFETRDLPVYRLVVAKNGFKIAEGKSGSPDVSMRNNRGEMSGTNATIEMLASSLTRVLQRKVIDETGLKGDYTFHLRYVPDEHMSRPSAETAESSAEGASLFTALGEQLGLNMKAGKGPVEVLVIDSAERPSAN
jgi:uncharacterized protein (TIGR03435 family)